VGEEVKVEIENDIARETIRLKVLLAGVAAAHAQAIGNYPDFINEKQFSMWMLHVHSFVLLVASNPKIFPSQCVGFEDFYQRVDYWLSPQMLRHPSRIFSKTIRPILSQIDRTSWAIKGLGADIFRKINKAIKARQPIPLANSIMDCLDELSRQGVKIDSHLHQQARLTAQYIKSLSTHALPARRPNPIRMKTIFEE